MSNYSGIQGLDANCNKNCGCTTSAFEPICDSNHTVYFSPCHAGCINVTFVNGEKVFKPCIKQSSSLSFIYVNLNDKHFDYFKGIILSWNWDHYWILLQKCSLVYHWIFSSLCFSHTITVPVYRHQTIVPWLTPLTEAAQKSASGFTLFVFYYLA